MISATESAINRLKEAMSNTETYFRFDLKGGGCSGFKYVFGLWDGEPLLEDSIFEVADGVRILVRKVCLKYLHGTTIDYKKEFSSEGFVFDNPNVTHSCGCANSVSFSKGTTGDEGSSGCSGPKG